MIVSKMRVSAVMCVGGLAFAAGCAPESQTEEEVTSVASTQEPLYIAESVRWEPTTAIPICWEAGGFGTEKAWTKDAIQGSWGTETGVAFTGWATCDSNFTTGIRILVEDAGPHTQQLGTGLDNNINGMRLNFTFANWSTSCAGASRESCIRSIAVHEFGHALGFAHEQNRPDTPASCDDTQGSDGTATYGAWDIDSAMNYCNPNWNNGGKLSPTDIAGASQYYGGSHPMSAAIFDTAGNKVVTWRGIDRAIYVAESGPTTGDTVSSMGGQATSDPAIVGSGGRFDIFVRGNNAIIYHLWKQGTVGFQGWTALGSGVSYSNPTAVKVGGSIYVFIRGADDALWYGVVTGSSFGGWSSLGGTVTGTPSATLASYTGSTPILHVAFRTPSGSLSHRSFNTATSTWSAWDSAGGSFWGSPVLVASGASSLDAIVRGKDDSFYRTSFNGTSWTSYGAIGLGKFYNNPGAVSWGPGRVDVFGRGMDNVLWHASAVNGAYTGWDSVGGIASSSPTAVSWASGRLGVYANGGIFSTISAYKTIWNGTAWSAMPILLSGSQVPRYLPF